LGDFFVQYLVAFAFQVAEFLEELIGFKKGDFEEVTSAEVEEAVFLFWVEEEFVFDLMGVEFVMEGFGDFGCVALVLVAEEGDGGRG